MDSRHHGGPRWKQWDPVGSMARCLTPSPLLLAVPIVGMNELYRQAKTGERPSTEELAPLVGVAGSAEVPAPEEGFSWETAAPSSGGPAVLRAVPPPPRRRPWAVPIVARALVAAALLYVAIARPFKGSRAPPGETAVNPPSGQIVTTGALTVTSTPPGASIVVDGTDRKTTTPATLQRVGTGSHVVLLRLTGYVDSRQNVTVTSGGTVALHVGLSKKPDTSKPPVEPSKPPVEPGTPPVSSPAQVETTLHITSTPGSAAIVLDGKNTGSLTAATIVVVAGSHTVSLKLAEYAGAVRTVTVAKGGQASISIPLTRTSPVAQGSLRITSAPAGAAVSVDGKTMIGKTPLTVTVTLGRHTILVSLGGYDVYSRAGVEVVKGIQTVIAAELVAIPVDLSYTNRAVGFGFRYPSTWQIVENPSSGDPLAAAEARSPAGPFVRVGVVPLNGGTVQTYLVELTAELEKLQGLTISETGTRTVGGIVYQHVVVLRAGSQTEYCLLQSGGNVYELQSTAEVGLLNGAAAGFRTILGSFFAAP